MNHCSICGFPIIDGECIQCLQGKLLTTKKSSKT